MKRCYSILAIVVLFFSCQENEEPMGEEETFWIYSNLLPYCQSGLPGPCLGISRSDTLNYDQLYTEFIPLEIENHTFKPYYFQKVQVLKFVDPETEEVKRKLIRVLAEEKDHYELLEGGWRVKRYQGEDLPNPSFPNGQTVGILPIVRMAVSSDGCNQVTLEIKKVGPDKFLSFGSMRITLKACPGEPQIIPFPWSKNFKREGNILNFYNQEGDEVAVWEKLN